jgi:CheY-like chemotaxis protein
MPGWRILDRLKIDLSTRHVPVCVISTDDARTRALAAGALGFLAKPLLSQEAVERALDELYRYVERPLRRLVVAMGNAPLRDAYVATLERDVELRRCETIDQVREALPGADALVLDAEFALEPQDVAEAVQRVARLCQPAVVFAQCSPTQAQRWRAALGGLALQLAEDVDGLLAETAYVLHRSPGRASERERAAVEAVHRRRHPLAGKKALIVDDDMRNIFALATVLDDEGMLIVSADNGREAIRLVQADPSIDIVLMDIMMPEMDGIATMQEIRQLPRGRELPMVAVTAKAMKGDRQKCIEAGAWDYIAKPVESSHLLAVLRGWLCR